MTRRSAGWEKKMKNRPLFTVCLIILSVIVPAVGWGGQRFLKELKPSLLEKYVQEQEVLTVSGTVSYIEQKDTYRAIYLKNNSVDSKDRSFRESNILIYTDSDIKLHIGNQVTVLGEAAFFDHARNPGNFDQKLYYQRQDIHGMVWASQIKLADSDVWKCRDMLYRFRIAWKERLQKTMGEKEGGILSAMLLGDRTGMDQDVKDLYQANGIAHVLAVSGLHLSFVGLGIYQLLRRMTGSYLAGGAGGILILGLYILMIGCTVSVVRALVMFLLRVGADIAGAHYDSPTALSLAAVIVLCWRPLSLTDGGFWMSFGAVLSMMLASSLSGNIPAGGIWGSISIQIVLLPVLLYYFYEIPMYSVLLNLYVIPLMSVLLFCGMLGSLVSIFCAPVSEVILGFCGWILKMYEKSCAYVLKIPGARLVPGKPEIWKIVVYYSILAIVILMLRGKAKGWKKYVYACVLWGAAVCILTCRPEERGMLQVTMLDVGQGDCVVMQGPSGGTYMMDGGSSDVKHVGRYRMEAFLKSRGIYQLDYVFVSHGDSDHINGIEELIERQRLGIKIHTLVFPNRKTWDDSLEALYKLAKSAQIRVAVMEPGETIREGEMTLTCLFPKAEEPQEKGNASSLVLSLQYDMFDMLLTGDLEGEGEACLTQILKEQYRDTRWDVLKVAHHGSGNSSGEEFLEQVQPAYALISAGRNNRYGHPNKEVLNNLEKSKIYRTDMDGSIMFKIKNYDLKIETCVP